MRGKACWPGLSYAQRGAHAWRWAHAGWQTHAWRWSHWWSHAGRRAHARRRSHTWRNGSSAYAWWRAARLARSAWRTKGEREIWAWSPGAAVCFDVFQFSLAISCAEFSHSPHEEHEVIVGGVYSILPPNRRSGCAIGPPFVVHSVTRLALLVAFRNKADLQEGVTAEYTLIGILTTVPPEEVLE